MLLQEKITNLQNRLATYQAVLDQFPDAYIVEEGQLQYVISPTVMRTSEDVEFLGPSYADNAMYHACIYTDVSVGEEKLRVYGANKGGFFKTPLFILRDRKLHCHNYHYAMTTGEATNAAIIKIDTFVVDFIQEHQVQVEKNKLPENIKGLLAFL